MQVIIVMWYGCGSPFTSTDATDATDSGVGHMAYREHPIANDAEFQMDHDLNLYLFGIEETHVYVWERSMESGWETFVEWLDENAPGYLTDIGPDELKDSAKELGLTYDPDDYESEDFCRILEHAGIDLSAIGHTSLDHGNYLSSDWTVSDIERGDSEWEAAALRSDGRTFYAVGNGQPGCLYDSTHGPYETQEEAIEDAIRFYELTDSEGKELESNPVLYLRGDRTHEVGAAMIEVFAVDCTWESN